jgi:hypothetical protein
LVAKGGYCWHVYKKSVLFIDGKNNNKNNNNDDKQAGKEDQQKGRQGRTTVIERQSRSVDQTPFRSIGYREEIKKSRVETLQHRSPGVAKSRIPKS